MEKIELFGITAVGKVEPVALFRHTCPDLTAPSHQNQQLMDPLHSSSTAGPSHAASHQLFAAKCKDDKSFLPFSPVETAAAPPVSAGFTAGGKKKRGPWGEAAQSRTPVFCCVSPCLLHSSQQAA